VKLIVGLGNPGEKYTRTRHNLGFLVLNVLASSFQRSAPGWKYSRKFKSEILKINYTLDASNYTLVLAKPRTFVNQSGIAVKKIVDFYKIRPEDVLVIRDDIDLPEGKIKGPYNETGSGGHRGIESVKSELGSDKFYQLKIGVGRPPKGQEADQWVLEKMTEHKWQEFFNLLKTYKGRKGGIVEEIEDWIIS
jgi:PTH1 family peptidyl-tRNA hydrolase